MSIFNAIHFTLHNTLPENSTLQQYLQIFLLVTKLLVRSRTQIEDIRSGFPQTISLLVVMISPSPSQDPIARATIGFSAAGSERTEMICNRFQNLAALGEIGPTSSNIPLGNCAECETLAHLDNFVQAIEPFEPCLKQSSKVLAITSTLNLKDKPWSGLKEGESVKNCGNCARLLTELRRTYHPRLRTLDLVRARDRLG
jgi:hypothetical protein